MIKIPRYTLKGTKTGEVALPKELNVKPNLNLLAQAVFVYRNRAHVGLRKTKTRAEINRTTKKVYKQKGTGGARHGSRRANLFRGGGVALGPRPVKRVLTLSDKIKKSAKLGAYFLKAKDGRLVFVSGIGKIAKTKEVKALIHALGEEMKAKTLTFVLSKEAAPATKFLRNLMNVRAILYPDSNAFDIWDGGLIILDEEIFGKIKTGSKEPVKVKKIKK
jgi:large subunit ribosomal protein L4